MRIFLCFLSIIMLFGLFSGCEKESAADTTILTAVPTTAPESPVTEPTPTEPPAVQAARECAFTATSIRTDGYHEEIRYPVVRIIRSKEELQAYCEENKTLYQLGNGYDDAFAFIEYCEEYDEVPSFIEYCEKYDDAYFEKQALILVLTQSGSGSVRFRTERLQITEEGKLAIYIELQVPEVGTADMALWHNVIEPEAGVTIPGENHIQVYLDDTLSYDGHSHQLATQPEIVEHPTPGYCGNTFTTIRYLGEEYGFMGGNSVELTDLLRHLDYNPYKVCKCLPELSVETEFGTYGVHLSEGYARCENGQAALTREQVQTIRNILEYEMGQAVVLSEEDISQIARKYCDIEYDNMELQFDEETQIWTVYFSCDDPNVLGGAQVVKLKANGNLVDVLYID